MTTAATSLLGLALPVTGELSGTWGDTVNNSITALLDSAVAGTTTLSADVDVTLTTTTLAANQAREAIILWTAAGTVTRYITAPAQSKIYAVLNKSSTQSIVLRGVGPTTGVTILAGKQAMVAWDGTDYVEISSGYVDGPTASTDNAVARFDGTDGKLLQNSVVIIADTTGNMTGVGTLSSGAITSSSLTATRVLFAGTSGLIQDDADLTFNGTTLTSTGFAGPLNGTVGATTPAAGYFTDVSATGQVTSTKAGSATTGAGQFYLNGATSNRIDFNSNGATTPSFTTRSDGTKLTLFPALSGSQVDYAIGISAATQWYSVPVNSNSFFFKWFGGETQIASLDGTGALTLAGGVTLSGGTANGVTYLNASKVLTSGTALTFDGTNFGVYGDTTGTVGIKVTNNNATGVDKYISMFAGGTSSGIAAWNNSGVVESAVGANLVFSGYNGTILFQTGTSRTEQMRLTSSLLSVVPGATIQGLTVGRGAGAIATNTAVGASALAANTTGATSTAIGENALGGAAYTGSQSVAVGNAVLYPATSATANTGIGYNALRFTTTGSNNTAIGAEALKINTTASNNTAVGYQAGYTNSTGTNGTYLGLQAGYTTTGSGFVGIGFKAGFAKSGADNFASVMVGNEAGVATTSGLDNTFVGGFVARANTTGSSNTALGTAALYSNTTASSNTAVGYQAGYSNTVGEYSVFLGYQAGYTSNRTADVILYSTFVGALSGKFVTTGNYNTFVGEESGYNVTSGSKNTILGRYNGNQGGLDIRTASNYIVLSDGDGNPRAYWNGANATFNGNLAGTAFQGSGAAYTGTSGNVQTLNPPSSSGVWMGWNKSGGFTEANLVYGGGYFEIGKWDGTTYTAQAYFGAGGFQSVNSISVGNATPTTSGAGITFPATQSASTNANTLDDYEEGTWTPNVGGTATYTTQTGTYTKIGRQVTLAFDLTINVIGTGSTTTILGMPFAIGTNAGSLLPTYWSNLSTGMTAIMGVAVSTQIDLVGTSAAQTTATYRPTILTSGSRLQGTYIYFV